MKKWFYICISAVVAGFLAFVITFVKYDKNYNEYENILPIKINSDKSYATNESSIMINPKSIEKLEKDDIKIEKSSEDINMKMETLEVVETSTKPLKYIMPLEGEIIKEYSNDNLIYSNTLKEWSTHNGIDIGAKINEEVKSISNGKILNIETDLLYGNKIEIEHENGIVSIYSGIEPIKNLAIGDEIKSGDVIGYIVESSGIELMEEPHLHFEILKDNIKINPLTIIN